MNAPPNLKFGVVIVAGGRVDARLAHAIGTDRKCLAQVAGRTCLDRVLEACAEAALGPVALVTGTDVWQDGMPATFVPERGRQMENVRAGVEALEGYDNFVFLPADAPFLQAKGVREFAWSAWCSVWAPDWHKRAEPWVKEETDEEPDLYVPLGPWLAAGLCESGVYKRSFPECPKQSLRLRSDRWHSGAYFAASREGFEKAATVIAGFSEDRRSQVKMALRLGLPNAFKFATGQFGLRDGEDVLAKVFGCPVRLIEGADPESIVDIDDPKEYAQVLEAAKRYSPS